MTGRAPVNDSYDGFTITALMVLDTDRGESGTDPGMAPVRRNNKHSRASLPTSCYPLSGGFENRENVIAQPTLTILASRHQVTR